MRGAGFVLAGGKSTRMGRDKALLPFGAATLVQVAASKVHAAIGNVALVGDPQKYAHLGLPVYPDLMPGYGPISGLHTILKLGWADWNLVAACDMPHISNNCLEALLQRTETVAMAELSCIVPIASGRKLEPLCAIYHSSCLPVVEDAIRQQRFRMMDLLTRLNTVTIPALNPAAFANINTPGDLVYLQPAAHER